MAWPCLTAAIYFVLKRCMPVGLTVGAIEREADVLVAGHDRGATNRARGQGNCMTDDALAATVASLRRLALIPAGAEPELVPLTGGVASDIWLVRAGGREFVVKRALEKLRVAADWRAPVSRNASEVAWFRRAAMAVPERGAEHPGA